MAKEFLVRPFELKSDVDEEKGTFEGYGSIFGGEKDSYRNEYWGDIVEKGAFSKTIKKGGRNRSSIAMLYQHNPEQIPGVWTQLVEDGE